MCVCIFVCVYAIYKTLNIKRKIVTISLAYCYNIILHNKYPNTTKQKKEQEYETL